MVLSNVKAVDLESTMNIDIEEWSGKASVDDVQELSSR